jgi:GNAT superfamily N-acetyltransferase
MALIALRIGPTGEQELVGVGRLIMEHERNAAEFALLISDSLQGKGLGTEVLRRLVEVGRKERVGRIVRYILESIGTCSPSVAIWASTSTSSAIPWSHRFPIWHSLARHLPHSQASKNSIDT